MTSKTGRLRTLRWSGAFIYMPSAVTPLEGRLAGAVGCQVVYASGASGVITGSC